MKKLVTAWLLLMSLQVSPGNAQTTPTPSASGSPGSAGSASFCLYEVPVDDSGKRKWVNLGIVQYVDLNRNDLRFYYGGGNFGGGYEVRVPVASAAEGLALLDHMRAAAAACR
jgi:hypothetical protein